MAGVQLRVGALTFPRIPQHQHPPMPEAHDKILAGIPKRLRVLPSLDGPMARSIDEENAKRDQRAKQALNEVKI
jgi:hypothetical protein